MIRLSRWGRKNKGSDLRCSDISPVPSGGLLDVLVLLITTDDASTAVILDQVPLIASAGVLFSRNFNPGGVTRRVVTIDDVAQVNVDGGSCRVKDVVGG